MRSIILVLGMILTASPSIAGTQPALSRVILKLLNDHNSKVKWDQMIDHADVNCDGVEDYIIKGKSGTRLYIAVVIGPLTQTSKVSSVNIGLGNEKYQDSLLEQNPRPSETRPSEMLFTPAS